LAWLEQQLPGSLDTTLDIALYNTQVVW